MFRELMPGQLLLFWETQAIWPCYLSFFHNEIRRIRCEISVALKIVKASFYGFPMTFLAARDWQELNIHGAKHA